MSELQHADCGPGGNGHGSLGSYLVGFALSILLTLIPYGMVTSGGFPKSLLLLGLVSSALLQLWVQLSFFLHLSGRSSARWNTLAFGFTAVVVAIMVVGTLWIMYNLNYNMMENIF